VKNLDCKLVKNNALVCGVDEVGRGAIAGPVVAAAVILKTKHRIPGVNDSKLLTPKVRAELVPEIKKKALAVGISAVHWRIIDQKNIVQATFSAMRRAVARALAQLGTDYPKRVVVLADGWAIPQMPLPCYGITKGDRQSQAIACASIIAKVFRDELMKRYDQRFPGYGFAQHKGYGTPAHIEALSRLGISPIHRRTFEPVRSLITPDTLPAPAQSRRLEQLILTEILSSQN
jgi:ribonuclease HII